MASKASCPLPCSAHVAVFCSIHCDGLTHPDGSEPGVAGGSFTRGADGADAVPDLCDISWSPNDSAGVGVCSRADSVSGGALELVVDGLAWAVILSPVELA